MKAFAITTLGCKVNQYEGQQIRQLLEQLGLNQAETAKRPDVVVINTCCVTHSASAKSRQCLRRAQKLSPDAFIVVCGCLPSVEIGELGHLGKNIRLIRERAATAAVLTQIVNGEAGESNSRKLQTDQHVNRAKNGPKVRPNNNLRNPAKLPQLTSFKGHTRAFLKVQDGCDGYCSYCIIPKARPNVHSKAAGAVLQEAEALAEAGHKEIVVTGVFLGAYGQESVRRKTWANQQNDKLADLLDKMARIPGLARIRLSSLEPGDVTERLVDSFCRHRNIMPHLHLSLQSGSDAVLKRMGRQYSVCKFLRAVELVKSRLDRPAITADVIVGFPGETEGEFEATVGLARAVGFAKMHVFGFSARRGTAAAEMQGVVDNRVIKRRSKVLRDLDAELGRRFREGFIGEECEILVENGGFKGRSERYFMVFVRKTGAKKLRQGELVQVRLVENREDGVIGKV
ncbi:MAG: tRNA (N(6)-L-threonylcarbamoyladenosine(37)-C(2))-methylthiotransferase MtaB [Planctomycetota bacterium]|nr:MAG: tRNA (N(6)-L-threonylcarbamoyladenosine(37)-C(2))-methylthiotransferase MtaB [Planctomycetota bacterium]